jgi:hypothetical protein
VAYKLAERRCELPEYYSGDIASLIAAHRAVTDLLIKLAEVE